MIAIIGAVITGVATVLPVVLTNIPTSRSMNARLDTSQAVTETKLEELTREVREHNGFARRMPVVEEQIREINHRIEDLEGYHKVN